MKRWVAYMLALALLLAPGLSLAEPQGYLSILLIGEDDASRKTVEKDESEYGRADAILVATLELATGRVRMLSIDRDWEIELPGQGPTKLCLANYLGGPELLVEQVNALLGLDIALYAMIDKADMGKVVERMGGVTIDISKEDMRYVDIRQTGPQKLDGAQVVNYMGSREMDLTSGDVERNERQRIVLAAIMEQVFSGGATGMMAFADAVLPLMTTNITLSNILSVVSSVVATGLSRPVQARSPEAANRLKRFAGGHDVVYVDDMAAETARVQAFLYE